MYLKDFPDLLQFQNGGRTRVVTSRVSVEEYKSDTASIF